MAIGTSDFSWRALVVPAFLPTFVFSLGEGAVIPIIPIIADDIGAGLALAGLIAAMITIGTLVGDIPAGALVGRFGERPIMITGAGIAAVGTVVGLTAREPLQLGAGILLIGMANAAFGIARHAFLTTFVPALYRARALATLAGVFRGGWLIGPFTSAAIIALTGSTSAVFWALLVACVAVIVLLVAMPDPERTFGGLASTRQAHGRDRDAGQNEAAAESHGILRTLVRHRTVLARIGSGAAILSAVRASRMVILPLWAVSIGVAPADAAVIIGIGGAIDFTLFYASGQVMDRFGRVWTTVPGLIGLAAGHFLLAATHDLPAALGGFIAATIVLALANGVTSGVILTLGADLAPPEHPAPFLGAFRFITDAGGAAAPLAISLIALASIIGAAGAMGVLALVGAALFGRNLPRYVPHTRARR